MIRWAGERIFNQKEGFIEMKLLKERDCGKLINQSSCSEKPRKIKVIVFVL